MLISVKGRVFTLFYTLLHTLLYNSVYTLLKNQYGKSWVEGCLREDTTSYSSDFCVQREALLARVLGILSGGLPHLICPDQLKFQYYRVKTT